MPYALDARATALPRSLALSSLSYLTLVVLLLFARTLFHAPAPRVIDLPPAFDIPPNDVTPYVPQPPGVVPPAARPPVIPDVPQYQHTEQPVKDDTVARPSPTTPTSDPGSSSTRGGGGNPGPGTAPAGDLPAPEPGTFEYTESLPVLVHRVQPAYPELARQAGMDGSVTLWLRVGTDGRVHQVRVEGKPSLFDEEASNAGREFVFTQATTDGHPVAVWVRIAIKFVLRD